MAYYFTTLVAGSVLSKQNFIDGYKEICANFGLDASQSNLVAVELESHTGLFLQSGYDQYEFVHKSIQEYLSAEYIVKLPAIPSDVGVMQYLGAEMAVAVSISSNPSLYICELVLNILTKMELPLAFYDAFVNRLLQEKPSFREDKAVIIAFFNLLTIWANQGKVSNIQDRIKWISSNDTKQYSLFLGLIQSSNPVNVISQYYDAESTDAVEGGLTPVKRRQNLDGYRILPYILAPAQFLGGPFGENRVPQRLATRRATWLQWPR